MRRSNHEVRYEASGYHFAGKSIPVKLFEELCAAGESPTKLWDEFNHYSNKSIPLFPLNIEEN